MWKARIPLVLFVFILPFTAHAGIISFISDLFSDKIETIIIKGPNSQKIDLLQAPLTSSAVGGADISIVDGNYLISETGPAGSSADILKESGQISIYVVREGDSLSQIAQMFGVSTNTIKWGNDIKGNTISPGQTLVILPVSGVRYTVKSGDTLASITKTYKGDIEEVLAYNNLSSDIKLAVGDVIIIPNGTLSQVNTQLASKTSGTASQIDTNGYYIRPISGGYKSQGVHGYNGVDLAVPLGTPIFASASGSVTVSRNSGWNGGYGNYIVISHPNGTQTLYAHNLENVVFVGEQVSQGQLIGYVGSTGRSTGAHVHFEVRGAKNPF